MRRAFVVSLFAAASTAAATAQPQPAAPVPAAATNKPLNAREVVTAVREVIAKIYVLPERRPAIDAVLARGLASGRYDVTDRATLAQRIDADLAEAGKDKHLNFRFDPQAAAAINASRTPSAPSDRAGGERAARARNHGVAELKVLPGNIRYMDYRGFEWTGDESRAALDTALQFLGGGDAVIIDLRRNGGGSPQAVQHIVSHFMEADQPLVTFYMGGQPTPNSLSTLRDLKVSRMIGKPLYVLTSPGTASAAEEFTGHVGGYRLGELVGEKTAGAGFRNTIVTLEGEFVLSVSIGRSVLASTGKDWEAVGLAPTIATPVHRALDTAHAHALRRLAAAAQGAEKAQLEAVADGIAARAERRAAALPLNAYAGNYGERVISLDGNALYYQRGARARERLIALGGNVFAFENDPMIRLDFAAANGSVAAMEVGSPGLPPQGRYERTR